MQGFLWEKAKKNINFFSTKYENYFNVLTLCKKNGFIFFVQNEQSVSIFLTGSQKNFVLSSCKKCLIFFPTKCEKCMNFLDKMQEKLK